MEAVWALVSVEGLLPQEWAGLCWGFRRTPCASLDAHAGRGLKECKPLPAQGWAPGVGCAV